MRECKQLVALAVAALLAVSACSTKPSKLDSPEGSTNKILQQAVDHLATLGVTGAQARFVNTDGRDVAVSSGVSVVGESARVPTNGKFRIGSATKTFVATVVLQLVGEGVLSLDDRMQRWLPQLMVGAPRHASRITLRNLLQHTSGIPDSNIGYESPKQYFQHRFDVDNPDSVVRAALKKSLDFAPGKGWAYSNTGYVILGMIIERATGKSWHEQVNSRIISRLGLSDTTWPGNSPHLPNPHAHGYQQFDNDGPMVDVTKLVDVDASGGLISTTKDVGTFYRSLFSGRLLDKREFAAMRQTVPVNGLLRKAWPDLRYGLGIFSVGLSCGGKYWMHNGGQTGFLTDNGVTEDGKRSIVVSASGSLSSGEPILKSDGFKQVKSSANLVDAALCAK